MCHMKTASVRDLRYHFAKIERALAQGQEIQITKRKRVIGKLVPPVTGPPPKPDFLARLKAIYGDRVLKPSTAELLAEERDRFR